MSILVPRCLAAWLCSCLMLGVAPRLALGQSTASLSLQSALQRSLADNPDLKVFGHELTAQQGRIAQAGARPAWELNLAVENVLGSGEHQGMDQAETTLTLGWLFERGARERRVNAAQAGLSVLDSEAQLRRVEVAAETARRFLTALTCQQQLLELYQAVQLSKETLASVQARVAAAKVPGAEAARAYAQLTRVQLAAKHGEHELATARMRLAAMWGEGGESMPASFTEVSGDLLSLPPLADFAALRAQLVRNPDKARLLTTQRLRDAELQVAQGYRHPAWQLNAGVRRFENTRDQALIVGITVPLPSRAAAQGAVLQAHAQSQQVQAQAAALDVQLNAELFAFYQELQHAYAEVTGLRDEVLPRMTAALEQSRYAYERGRYSYLEWVAAQRELTEIRSALLAAAANVHRYRIEIERLTGAALDQRANP